MLKTQSELLKGQIGLAAGLVKALEGADTGDVTESIRGMNEALSEAAATAEETGVGVSSSMGAVAKAFLKSKGSMKGMKSMLLAFSGEIPKAKIAALAFLDGLASGFMFSINLLKSLTGLTMSVAGAFLDIGKAILSIPLGVLDGLIMTANKLRGIMQAIATSTEEVRKAFGDLVSGPGLAVVSTAKSLTGELEKSGLTGYRVFGNLAERLDYVNKLAQGMNGSFEMFKREISGPVGTAILLMQKGLGATAEDMGGLARKALAMGSSLEKELRDASKYALSFGNAFGLSIKNIGRDIAAMSKDVQNFGNLGPRALAKVSVYSKKLGIEFKSLLGIVEQFDTFESAAISSAKLSQAFGANVDAIRLMRAENPADRLEELRRGFFAAGQSAEKLTRQELKLLSQTTGLNAETARTVFSQKNMGVTMAQLEKQGKIAQNRQITTAQAVQKLASSIERIIKPFREFTGFLTAFADGFARGVFGAKDFRTMLTGLYGALRKTYMIGIRVGKIFVDMFPGVKDMVNVLNDFFSVSKKGSEFKKFIESVEKSFKSFFSSVITGDVKTVGNLLSDLEDSFGILDAEGKGKKFIEGFKKFGRGIGLVMGQLIKIIQPEIEKILNDVWKKIEPSVMKGAVAIGALFFATMFSAGVIKAGVSFLVVSLGEALIAAFAGGTAASSFAAAAGAVSSVLFNPLLWVPALIGMFAALGVGVSAGMKKFGPTFTKEFGAGTSAAMASAAAGMIDTLTFGLLGKGTSETAGRWIGQFAQAAGGYIKTIFGPAVFMNIKKQLDAGIKLLASLGDFAKAIFSGDMGVIKLKALEFGSALLASLYTAITEGIPMLYNLGERLLGAVVMKGIPWLFDFIQGTLIPGLLEIAAKVLSVVSHIISGMFKRMSSFSESIPLIGGLLAPIFEFLGDTFELIGDVFGFLGEKLNDFRVMIKGMGGYSSYIGLIFEMMKLMAEDALEYVGEFFTVKYWKDLGSNIMKGLVGGLKGIGTTLSAPFKGGISKIKKALGIASPSKVMMSIGKDMAAGVGVGVRGIPDALEAASKIGVTRVKSAFDKISQLDNAFIRKARKTSTLQATGAIDDLVKEASAVSDTVESIKTLDIDAKLKQLGDKLGIEGDELTIKHRDSKFIINLNVTMEADKLVKVLAESGVVTTEISR